MTAVERARRAVSRIVSDGVHADPDNPRAYIAFPDDVAALRALAVDMVKARPANVEARRQELLRQLDAAANVDTAPEWRP